MSSNLAAAVSPVPPDPGGAGLMPSRADLDEVCRLKYGEPEKMGWGPKLRQRFDYYTPEEYYEALVMRLVTPGTSWLDVGCGREVLPCNQALAKRLAARCETLVGVDPDVTILENRVVHHRVQSPIESYNPGRAFDLVTLRMVAEHITDPASAVAALTRLVRRGGKLVIYTVNKWAPVSLAAWVVPFRLHHPVKRILWQTEEKDTFPVAYRMNTRGALRKSPERKRLKNRGFAGANPSQS